MVEIWESPRFIDSIQQSYLGCTIKNMIKINIAKFGKSFRIRALG